jgi:prepilin-type N-terminal cleavage/methylation domain-containing protein
MEKGFALIEMVVTMGILCIVMPAMVMTISTLLINHEQPNDHNIVSQQVFWR